MQESDKLSKLIQKENWRIVTSAGEQKIEAFGQLFPVRHPVQIYLKLYREETNPDQKYNYMKAAHDYLWPDTIKTWHYWTEERFRAHCEGWNYITLAGGASTAKSYDMAKIAVIFWLSDPKRNAVIISSTTLESLGARIWGYAMNLLSKMAIKLPVQYTGGNSPKVLFPIERGGGEIKDTQHGMFAIAAKSGDAEKSISSWIGRHPENSLMLVMDEATDITANVLGAFANLDTGGKPFQCYAIGNSNSTDDLHGAMSTPKVSWDKVDPLKDKRWETTQKNGLCLFFSCYDSPAVHEQNPEKKKLLSKFLITKETIESKKIELGADSDAFWRFVVGFWRHRSTESVIASKQFIESFGTNNKAHFGGITPLSIVGGEDIAYASGGDECILQLAVLGVDIYGLYTLDFRGDELTFRIPINRNSPDSADIQIAKQTLALLRKYNCLLNHVAIDATGQGRAMGGVLQLMYDGRTRPISVYSTKTGVNQDKSFDITIMTTYELWYNLREFIQNGQIRGLSNEAIMQLSERQIIRMPGGKVALESKADYKKRIGAKYPGKGHSPDKADAAALATLSAVMNFGFSLGKKRDIVQNTDFNNLKWIEYKAQAQQEQIKQKEKVYVPNPTFKGTIEALAKRRIF